MVFTFAVLRVHIACGHRCVVISGNTHSEDGSLLLNSLPRSTGNHMKKRLTAVIQREDEGYVALCPELDIASQGMTIQDARDQASRST